MQKMDQWICRLVVCVNAESLWCRMQENTIKRICCFVHSVVILFDVVWNEPAEVCQYVAKEVVFFFRVERRNAYFLYNWLLRIHLLKLNCWCFILSLCCCYCRTFFRVCNWFCRVIVWSFWFYVFEIFVTICLCIIDSHYGSLSVMIK